MSGRLLLIVLVAPTIVLILAVAVGALIARFHRKRCPACLQRGLKSVSFIRATDDAAQPEYWSYLVCEHCGERFKLREGLLTGVPDDELEEATRFG